MIPLPQRAHFIGICGKGMSAVAKLLHDLGWIVTGSDADVYPPVSDELRAQGLPCAIGYRAENIPKDVDLIVIGKNAKLVPETNPEVKAAFDRGVRIASFPDVLHDLTEHLTTIVVAGSHGKSTVTALITWCLREAGKDPSYFIGEVVRGLSTHAALGSSDLFVLEGDEYPSSNWNSTSKFLHYRPNHVLLTSAVHDHVNIFPTQTNFDRPFQALLDLIPPSGSVTVCADEPNAVRISQSAELTPTYYGLDSPLAHWSATDLTFGSISRFILVQNKKTIIPIETSLLGRHNIQNIVGASALLLEQQLLTPDELAQGIASFQGVKRRLERLTEKSQIPLYEGYGSSFEKARSAIAAMRVHFPDRRLVVLFEPHTFSWRSRDMLHWYDTVFQDCGLILTYTPATQGQASHNQASFTEIIDRLRQTNIPQIPIHNPTDALQALQSELRPTDAILILTSGGFDGLIQSIPKFLEQHFPI